MSFKKILAVMLSAVTACSISAAALTLDVAEAAKEGNVAEAADCGCIYAEISKAESESSPVCRPCFVSDSCRCG